MQIAKSAHPDWEHPARHPATPRLLRGLPPVPPPEPRWPRIARRCGDLVLEVAGWVAIVVGGGANLVGIWWIHAQLIEMIFG